VRGPRSAGAPGNPCISISVATLNISASSCGHPISSRKTPVEGEGLNEFALPFFAELIDQFVDRGTQPARKWKNRFVEK
jgi:hypothetical protein